MTHKEQSPDESPPDTGEDVGDRTAPASTDPGESPWSQYVDAESSSSSAHESTSSNRSSSGSADDTNEASDSLSCPECDTDVQKQSDVREVACPDCGLILEEDNIDRGPDWRNYSDSEEDKSRAEYTSKRFYDDNMGSEIGRQPNGTSGVSAAKRKQLSRLRREQSRAKLSNGNNRLSNLLGEANRMASALGLSKVIVDGACNLIRAVHSEYSITGHSIESIASAAVYLSARELNEPVSLENITRVSRVTRKAITTSRQKICNDLGLEIEPASPTDYFAQLVPDLDLDTETIHESRTILKAMEERHPEVWAGAHPLSKVGAALYLASFYTGDLGRVSVPTIADQVGRSEEAVTDRYSDIVGSLTLSELVDSRHSPSA